MRPHLKEFLEDMSKYYEIIIYTAAEQEYADKILNFIDPKGTIFSFRLYRQYCLLELKKYLFKLLELFCGNRNLKEIVIVDNTSRNYTLSVANGLPITDYKGQLEDNELSFLGKYLRELATFEDITEKIKEDFANFLKK